MSKIFVTGGCGFIGSHLVDSLAKNPDNVVNILDNLSTGSLQRINDWKENTQLTFIKKDKQM